MLSPSPHLTHAALDSPTQRLPTLTRRLPLSAHLLIITVALVTWAASLPFADLSRLDGYGLLPRLPPTFLAAVVVLCAGFVLATRRDEPMAERIVLLYLAALVVALFATIPLLYDEPRYAFVYKHIAVIHYIEAHGAVNRDVDIYQNWPGFFALNAAVSQVTGVDALRYANWTQVLFPLADLFALRYVFSALTSDRRRIHVGLLIFLLGSWVEYGYLAPQSLGFFLTLVVFGVVLHWLRPDPTHWFQRLLGGIGARLPRRLAAPQEMKINPPAVAAWVGILLVLTLSLAIITSHQLTPFFLVVDLGLLVLARRCRDWWLPLAVVGLTVFWIALAHGYLSAHFPTLLGGSPVSNFQPSNHPVPGAASASAQFIANVARVLALLVFITAISGAWRDVRRGKRPFLVLALAFAPLSLVLVQSYGGEGIYRVYMFAMPWLAYLGAGLFAGAQLSFRRALTLFAGAATAATLILTSYYGLEHENYMPKQEVAATQWFDANTPSGSVLMLMIENHPYPLGAYYDQHLAPYGHYAGDDVLTSPHWANTFTAAGVNRLHDLVAAAGPKTYLMLSPSQIAYAENHGYAPAGSLTPFFHEVVASRKFRVVFHDGDSYVLRPVGEQPR